MINAPRQTTIPVSVVILAHNEAGNIARCVDSVRECGEVVVVDDDSTDATAEIAQQHGARVVNHAFTSFASQRNWALESADLQHDWVLMLDADEAATSDFLQEIQQAIDTVNADVHAFRNCRKTMLHGRWLKYSDGFPVWIMRLVRRGHAQFEDAGHGEVPIPVLDGQVETIREPFLHFPFSRGLEDWFHRHNRYSSREAQLEVAQMQPFRLLDLASTDRALRRSALRSLSRRLPLRPQLRFFYQYVIKCGFLDGAAGLQFCRMMAMYEAQIVMKRREIEHQLHQNR